MIAGPVAVDVRGWGWRHSGRRDWALRGVDLAIAPGERVLLLGPSGAGKSTLLLALAGLLDPDSAAANEGEIRLDGMPVDQARGRVGLLQQDPESSLVMARAGDDVAFGLENRGVPRSRIWPRVDEALTAVGFGYDRGRATSALSGGEQQRLALAGALVAGPGLLALDEPTANLDPEGARLVRGAISDVLAASGATLVLIEHRVAQAVHLVDRVVVVEPGGGVVADGAPDEVFRAHGPTLAERGVWVPGHEPAPASPSPRGPAEGPPVVTARAVSLVRPDGARVLEQVTTSVGAGEALAVTGPNGVGKSTLALVLAGLLRPTTGGAYAGDDPEPLHRWRAAALARTVGTVFQDPEHQFLTGRVADELLAGPPRTSADRARADELLVRLRLDHLAEANPFTLSGGEQRRLSVATALVAAPDLVVLDEPTFGQDARTWAELVALCGQLRDHGRALFAVTHDQAFVSAVATRRVEAGAAGHGAGGGIRGDLDAVTGASQ